MMTLAARGWRTFDERFTAPAPARRIATLRILVGLFATIFLSIRSSYLFSLARLPAARFEPIGVLGFLDRPLPFWLVRAGVFVTIALGIAFTLGWRYRVSGPAFAVLLLLAMSYDNSWQLVAHTENLVTLHALILGFAPAADAYSLDAHRRGVDGGDDTRYGWPVRLMSIVTVVTYVIAAIAKQRNGGLEWITGDVLRHQIAGDNLHKILLGDSYSPIGARLVAHRWLFPPMAFATMVIEFGAPLALFRGRIRTVTVAALWLFHVTIFSVMLIFFAYPLSMIAYASLLRPERLADGVAARWRRLAPIKLRAAGRHA